MKLVVCEGRDDEAVLKGLCASAQIHGLKIEPCLGRGNLERYLSELQIRPEFTRNEVEAVAVFIDAEESSDASWRKVQNAVALAFKTKLLEPGEFEGTQPRVAAFIVAGGAGRGMIEDICLASVRDQPGYGCLEEYFRCLSAKTGQPAYHSKARFRAWMASQTEYEYYVGKAAEKGFLQWNSEAFKPMRDFLRRM